METIFTENQIRGNDYLSEKTVCKTLDSTLRPWQKDVHKLEEENTKLADFIICVDQNMTTTY